jgi:autophagy-related protein 13
LNRGLRVLLIFAVAFPLPVIYCIVSVNMAPSHGNSHSEAAKIEQIITEIFHKSLQIILEVRSPDTSSRNFSCEQAMSSPSSSTSSSSSVRLRDKWFNLALRECPAVLENLDLWRQSNCQRMVVDVVLVQRPVDWDSMNFSPIRISSSKERYPYCWNSDQDEFRCHQVKSEKIIERWVVQYESRKVKDNRSSGSRRSSNNTWHTLYKKSILLLRSLYATVRLLPAYKIFRDLNSSCQIRTFSLAHRVFSLVEPFSRREEAEMQRFGFTPLETSSGRICISVLYRSADLDISSESSTPMSPQVISDYVGSPLADPLKRFPSLSVAGSGTHGSPSSLPFSRRHSWAYDLNRASSPLVSFSPSPSPTHSEQQASLSYRSSRHFPPMSLPPHPPETSVAHKKNTSFDYYPSPTFSPSPSASPPICIPGSHLSKGLLRSESAPVNIPISKLANSPSLSNKQYLPPSPPIRSTRSGTLRTDNFMGPIQTGATVEQVDISSVSYSL